MSFEHKDYRNGGRTKETTLGGAAFLRRLARHLVPKGFRRIRYFGLLAAAKGRRREAEGAPAVSIGEKAPQPAAPACRKCGGRRWRHTKFRACPESAAQPLPGIAGILAALGRNRFSLGVPDTG